MTGTKVLPHTSAIKDPLAQRSDPPPMPDLDARFDALTEEFQLDFRRLRQSLDRFGAAYAERVEALGAAEPDDALRRAFRRLRQLQLIVHTIESSAAYLFGSGIEPGQRADDPAGAALRVHDSLESERARLSREVHDGPAQVLANAIFEIEYLERIAERAPAEVRTSLRAELAALKQSFRTSLDSVRAMIYDLRPPELATLGLAEALRNYAGEYESRYGLTVACHLDTAETELLPMQELTVYRVVQEALQNVHKHARASKVGLIWQRTAAGWSLSCNDDGTGFDVMKVARDPRRVGLVSMRERAELIGGTLDVRSVPAGGTTVTLTIPHAIGGDTDG